MKKNVVLTILFMFLLSATGWTADRQTDTKNISIQSKYIETNANDTRAYYSRGNSYLSQEKYELALKDFDKVIELEPNNSNAYLKKSRILTKLNQYRDGVTVFQQAISIMKQDIEHKNEQYLLDNQNTQAFNEKAKIFNTILRTPIWVEVATWVNKNDVAEAREKALRKIRMEANEEYKNIVSENPELQIPIYSMELKQKFTIIKEDKSGNYGVLVKESNSTQSPSIWNVTFRFLVKHADPNSINPYVAKSTYNKQSVISDFKDDGDYWQITAAGYAFYESFEDIDTKRSLAGKQGKIKAFQAIVKKARELGITDQDKLDKITQKLESKFNYGGVYTVLGCAVETDTKVPVKISKKDGALSFLYN